MNYNVQKDYDSKTAENKTQHNLKSTIANIIVKHPSFSPSEEFSRKVGVKIYKDYQYPKWVNEDILWGFSHSRKKRNTTENSSYLDIRNEMKQLNPDLATINIDTNNIYLLSCVFGWIASKFEISDIEYYLAIKAQNKDFLSQEIQKYKWDKAISFDEIAIIKSAISNTSNRYKKSKRDWREANIQDFGNIVIWIENGYSDSQIFNKLQNSPEELFLSLTYIYQYKTGKYFGFKISPKSFFTKLMETQTNN